MIGTVLEVLQHCGIVAALATSKGRENTNTEGRRNMCLSVLPRHPCSRPRQGLLHNSWHASRVLMPSQRRNHIPADWEAGAGGPAARRAAWWPRAQLLQWRRCASCAVIADISMTQEAERMKHLAAVCSAACRAAASGQWNSRSNRNLAAPGGLPAGRRATRQPQNRRWR